MINLTIKGRYTKQRDSYSREKMPSRYGHSSSDHIEYPMPWEYIIKDVSRVIAIVTCIIVRYYFWPEIISTNIPEGHSGSMMDRFISSNLLLYLFIVQLIKWIDWNLRGRPIRPWREGDCFDEFYL